MKPRRDWLRRALGVAGLSALGLPFVPAPVGAATSEAGPPMRRGLNLTHWFEYERAQDVSRDEMRTLQSLGFDHVRLPIDPIVCGWQPVADHPAPFVGELRAALDDALGAGLDVVVDLHLEPADKARIEASAQAQAAVVSLWARLARELGALPVQRVAFELFNEPQFYAAAAAQWPGFQRRMLDAVRADAPRHRVLLSGNQGASIEGLQRLAPVPDPAAVYVFHYYAPYLFTHQGAHWMDTRYTTAGLHHGVRYPAALQLARPARLARPHPRAAREMAEYLEQDWGPARVAREIRAAGDWARRQRVTLVCNEFGVLRASADAGSRYRWIGDVRRALEAEGIGWTLWDYTDIFGITSESSQPNRRGARRIEPEALQALGRDPARVAQR